MSPLQSKNRTGDDIDASFFLFHSREELVLDRVNPRGVDIHQALLIGVGSEFYT